MKEYIILILVLVFTFVPSFFIKNYLENSGKELLSMMEEMKYDLSDGVGYDKNKKEEVENIFLQNERKWIMIVDHHVLDEVEDELYTCIVSYEEEDELEFSMAYSKLRNHIEDLGKREEFSLSNIL